jgi:hypothetical protein
MGLERQIDQALNALSRRLGVSIPLISTTALADFLGIDLEAEDRCDEGKPIMRLVRKAG